MSDTKIRSQKATALLREDHREVKQMFSAYEKTEVESEKAELFEQVKSALTTHAQIEEEIFYPALLGVEDEECQELLMEAQEEHKIVKTLLEELSGLDPSAEQFDAKVKVLGENVEHHAEEEEKEMFPFFEQLPKEQQDEVSKMLQERKEDLS
ncbi:MAG TPA: hemerythrin domain-containing protein [Planctomycetota bacterium]